jgi:hypothetical protein
MPGLPAKFVTLCQTVLPVHMDLSSPDVRETTMDRTAYRTVDVDGLSVFYRETGPQDAPTILLLHGFPSSSRMWQTLLEPAAAPVPPGRTGLSRLRAQRFAQPHGVRLHL